MTTSKITLLTRNRESVSRMSTIGDKLCKNILAVNYKSNFWQPTPKGNNELKLLSFSVVSMIAIIKNDKKYQNKYYH